MPTPETPSANKDEKKESSPSGSTGSTAAIAGASSLGSWGDIGGLDEPLAGRLVEEVAGHTYKSEEELDEHLGKTGLLDQRKFIDLSKDGKAYWIEMPNHTIFHEAGVEAIMDEIKRYYTEDNGLLAREEPVLVLSDRKTKKYPDVAVYGKTRLKENGKRKLVELPNPTTPDPFLINPSVVIEFSWSNPAENETEKLSEQMVNHIEELQPVNCGILIKTRSSTSEYPTHGNRRAPPLIGFDVYIVDKGKTIDAGDSPTLTYRHGTKGDDDKMVVVDAARFGEDGSGVGFQIRLSSIKKALSDLNVQFE